MSIATTVPPAYNAPPDSSRSASRSEPDHGAWVGATPGTPGDADWPDQHGAAIKSTRPRSTRPSWGRHVQAHQPSPQAVPDESRAALSEALRQVYALLSLHEGWNGYDALPPTAESVRHALRWLEAQWAQCREEGIRWYAPNVTAGAEGEVVLEWWAEDRALSVFVAGGEAEYLKFGRAGHPLAGLREHGAASTAAMVSLMRWFAE